MNKNEALKKLELPINATTKQINSKFRNLAKKSHSDKGGNDKQMTELLKARDIAIGNKGNSALVPIENIKDIVLASYQPIIEQQNKRELKERSSALINEIKVRQTNNLKSTKRSAAILGSISGGIALLSNQFLPLLKSISPNNIFGNLLPIIFGFVGAVLGLLYWGITQKVNRLEQIIEEIKSNLEEKSNYVETINSILRIDRGNHLPNTWTRIELEEYIRELNSSSNEEDKVHSSYMPNSSRKQTDVMHLKYIAWKIGERDLAQIIITKGLEHQILDSTEHVSGNSLRVEYKLNLGKKI